MLFDKKDRTHVLARSENAFISPEFDWEKSGTVPNVIFLEGAVTDKNGGLTGYYGAADKYIGALSIKIKLQ